MPFSRPESEPEIARSGSGGPLEHGTIQMNITVAILVTEKALREPLAGLSDDRAPSLEHPSAMSVPGRPPLARSAPDWRGKLNPRRRGWISQAVLRLSGQSVLDRDTESFQTANSVVSFFGTAAFRSFT